MPRPTEPFRHEHAELLEHIERIRQAAREMPPYGLYAVISVHFRKEEDLQLPAFDAAPEVAASVLERMGATPGHRH